ncbi:hypothetical protein RRG08_044578 [Elysia crispata]|uniref:Uncharacterized protein n=1 Tax=Elysia crispata TaxID=231223 RepID=A0AAE0ZTM6_9GAST|nr:hypothetical protein RRG08_044578 [Elysia crispata]
MARIISCQTVTVLLFVLVAAAMGKDLLGREERSELPKGLLAALGGIPHGGVDQSPSLSKDTRSVSDGDTISGSHSASGSGCVLISGSSHSGGSSGHSGDFTWNLDRDRGWDNAVRTSSGVRSVTSPWTMVCVQILALVHFLFGWSVMS